MGPSHLHAFLGHAIVSTVAVCTQVGIKALKDLHQVMRLAATASSVKGGRRQSEVSAEDLLDALDAEGQEEAA